MQSRRVEISLTVDFNHEGLNDVVSDHFKVGVTNPVGNGGSGTGEEVVQNGDFVTEEHQSVDQVGTDETGTAGHEDSLSLGVGQELDGRELGHGGEGDRVVLFVVGRLSAVAVERTDLTTVSLGNCAYYLRSLDAVGGSLALDDLGSLNDAVSASHSLMSLCQATLTKYKLRRTSVSMVESKSNLL